MSKYVISPEDIIELFRETKDRVTELYHELDKSVFLLRPEPDSWSIGEHISHLNVSGSVYVEKIDKALEYAKKKTYPTQGPFETRFFPSRIISYLEPPFKKGVRSPKVFTPLKNLRMDLVFNKFMSLQEVLISQVNNSAHLDMSRYKVETALSKFIRLNLGETFMLIAVHQKRHLWKTERILEQIPGVKI